MAEKEGFEPSRPFRSLHDFQSCALDQLGDFSIAVSSAFRYALVALNRQRYYYNRDFKKVKPFSVFLLRNLRFLPELLRLAVLRLPRKRQIFHSGEEACARPPQKGCCAIEIKKLQNSCKALKIDSAERKDFYAYRLNSARHKI